MENTEVTKMDRVRRNSPKSQNQAIDNTINNAISFYKNKDNKEIDTRIEELEKEWSIERHIETFASSLILGGVLMATFFNKRWMILPGIVSAFLLQHGIQGWCPPVPLFRAFKRRTRKEIDWEKYALKVLRGDFDKVSKTNTNEIFHAVSEV